MLITMVSVPVLICFLTDPVVYMLIAMVDMHMNIISMLYIKSGQIKT
jgi:hypothetical protein